MARRQPLELVNMASMEISSPTSFMDSDPPFSVGDEEVNMKNSDEEHMTLLHFPPSSSSQAFELCQRSETFFIFSFSVDLISKV